MVRIVSVLVSRNFTNVQVFHTVDFSELLICYAGATIKEEKSTAPNPHPGTQVSSYSDSSSTGVIQHFHYGNDDEHDSDVHANFESFEHQFQEWQEKFHQEMDAFNENLNRHIQENIRNSFRQYK